MRVSVFERNMLQGGCLDVNRGSGNRAGWNGITGSFLNNKVKQRKDKGENCEMRQCN